MARISKQEQFLHSQQMMQAKLMFVAGVLLFLFSGFFWFEKVYGNSNNVFWSMVDANLKSYGVSMQAANSDPAQNVSQNQITQLQLGSQTVSAGQSKIIQNPGTPEQVKIDTESIGTLPTNYVRYTDIEINQKLPDGRTPDFAKLENVWAQEPNSGNGKSPLVNAMFGSLGRMPIANLNRSERQELVATMQDNSVYKINPLSVKKEYRGIRPVYNYEVDVNIQQYVFMLKKFDQMSGLNQIQSVDPTQFPENQKVHLKVTVDILSRNLLSVDYVANKQTENFTGFGAYRPITPPSDAVPLIELETQLQNILLGQ